MSSLAAAEESVVGEVPEDKSLVPSVYSHPVVQIIVTLFVISVVVNVVSIFILLS